MRKHYDITQEEFSFYGNEGASPQNSLAILIGPKVDASITDTLDEKFVSLKEKGDI
ncbi:hypothetical protein [Bacillus cereus]|uniref:hypothetical protein n=1 Tax=Bacillus cereus TaxID=1396 RepID=UPI001481D667|nr:hypothetical protein [Bacillus cereus]